MLDTNILCPGLRFPRGKNAKAIEKSLEEDDLQITSINYDEVCHAARRSAAKAKKNNKKPRMTYEETVNALNNVVARTKKGRVIPLNPLSDDELEKKYPNRDKSDRKIIYAADKTDTEILVTEDKDYYTENPGVPKKIRVIHVETYLDENWRSRIKTSLKRRLKL